jgi:hypothetical protein
LTVSAYRKFSDTLRDIETRGATAPKPPKAPKAAAPDADAGSNLDGLGALGGADRETPSSEPAALDTDDVDRTAAEGANEARREAEDNFGYGAHDYLNHLNLKSSWGDGEEERAAIVEYGNGVPRAWAEGFARLNPDRPPGDVPVRRWQIFVDDCGRFLDGGWAERLVSLGWGPLDLFGCDRERPFARIDHAGLLWLLNGDKLIELDRHTAVIERCTGARQRFQRRPVAVGDVVRVGVGSVISAPGVDPPQGAMPARTDRTCGSWFRPSPASLGVGPLRGKCLPQPIA